MTRTASHHLIKAHLIKHPAVIHLIEVNIRSALPHLVFFTLKSERIRIGWSADGSRGDRAPLQLSIRRRGARAEGTSLTDADTEHELTSGELILPVYGSFSRSPERKTAQKRTNWGYLIPNICVWRALVAEECAEVKTNGFDQYFPPQITDSRLWFRWFYYKQPSPEASLIISPDGGFLPCFDCLYDGKK